MTGRLWRDSGGGGAAEGVVRWGEVGHKRIESQAVLPFVTTLPWFCCLRRLGVGEGEDEVIGAVVAELGLVFPADYGEGVKDVARVIPGEAVMVELEGVEPGLQVSSDPSAPDEGRSA